MATSEVLDEILALKSIFCNPGEFYLINPSSLEDTEETQGPISFKIAVKCHPEQDLTGVANSSENDTATSSFAVEMTVSLPPDYPGTLPDISLSCMGMTKKSLSSLKSNLIEYATSLLTTSSDAIIMDLTIWLQENARSFLDKLELNSNRKMPTASKSILLLRLDHIRNKSRYTRTIARWVDELKLSGRIFFAGYLIFLLLTGTAESVKEYLRRHKTCNVDFDSSGKRGFLGVADTNDVIQKIEKTLNNTHTTTQKLTNNSFCNTKKHPGKPCKEKMMNILIHEQDLINLSICDFCEVECKSPSELEVKFAEMELEHLFNDHIQPLL